MTTDARPDLAPPYNLDAEEAVLGAILIDSDAYLEVASMLQADDFYSVKHGWLWDVFATLHDQRMPIDLLTVQDELERRGQLAEIGGPAYLTQLVTIVPTAFNAAAYGQLVEEAATRRRLLQAASDIAKVAYDEQTDIGEVVGQAEQSLFSVSQRRTERDLVHIQKVASEYYDRIQYLYDHRDEPLGVPTGFRDLDDILGGMQKSDLVIIAGRPGQGKSGFMISVALNAARHKKRVAFFSLEMSNEQVVQRMVAQETHINTHRLRLGELEEEEWSRFIHAVSVLSDKGIFLDDTPSISALQLRTKARRLAAEIELDLVVVDYLQLMTAEVGRRDLNRVQEVSYISRGLKALARDLNIPVLAGAQLSRGVEQRSGQRPMLSDLRESGCLTGDALIYLPDSGRYVPIQELAGQTGFQVMSVNTQTWKLEPATVTRTFCTGSKPVFRLTTQLGRTIRATANHKFLTIHGWKRIDELGENERIALPRTLAGSTTQSMSEAELALLGHLIGDGCTLPTHAIQYTTREEDLVETVVQLANEVFADEISPRINKERTWYQVYLAPTRHLTHGIRNPIGKWLEELGAFGLRSYEKRIPYKVFEQSSERIAVFLRHLWATDGCIHMSVGKKHYYGIYYATSSERLARGVQSLLIRLGINARLTRRAQNGKGRDQYHVTVSGKPDIERFIGIIGTVGHYKQRHLEAIKHDIAGRSANTNRDTIPRDIWRMYAVPAMQQHGITTRQLHTKLGNAYCGTALYKQNVSRERAERLAQAVHSDEIKRLAKSDVYWDNVKSIEACGEEKVFDLTVPGLHSFIANDIVVHNSIEQDSDVVLFLHHPDSWNEDPELKNVTEVLVAKHRNGPTGKVKLVFLEELAKFVDGMTRRVVLDGER